MHFHCEIIMPPTENVEAALARILALFDENKDPSGIAFWDWYVIGGRWSGSKLIAKLGIEKVEAFYSKLQVMEITTSNLQAGKPELMPESQVAAVDALWREMFPETGISVCPLFKHSNDQYANEPSLPGDICLLTQIPQELEAERVIIAATDRNTGELFPFFMCQRDFWNGCNFVRSAWNGNVLSSLDQLSEELGLYKQEAKDHYIPKDDWLCVTVDYHS